MTSVTPEDAEGQKRRQRWLSLLAKAPAERVEALWASLENVPSYTPVRRAETGLVMVKGRISGSGAPFAVGEMTVTRAAVRLDTGELGIGYVGGRHPRRAELAAAIDALGQRAEWRQTIEDRIVAPLEREADALHREIKARAAATKVDFFTVAREAGS
jgi:alpha-D-ribose 1-methylphosphonate 5-triphosphate synthase subunit PhnG